MKDEQLGKLEKPLGLSVDYSVIITCFMLVVGVEWAVCELTTRVVRYPYPLLGWMSTLSSARSMCLASYNVARMMGTAPGLPHNTLDGTVTGVQSRNDWMERWISWVCGALDCSPHIILRSNLHDHAYEVDETCYDQQTHTTLLLFVRHIVIDRWTGWSHRARSLVVSRIGH